MITLENTTLNTLRLCVKNALPETLRRKGFTEKHHAELLCGSV